MSLLSLTNSYSILNRIVVAGPFCPKLKFLRRRYCQNLQILQNFAKFRAFILRQFSTQFLRSSIRVVVCNS